MAIMRKLIPVLLALAGLGAGTGAGLALRPAPEPAADAGTAEGAAAPAHGSTETPDPELEPDYVKLNNQFVVPIVEDGRVVSMVIASLSLEVTQGASDSVHAREPKLRDAFLQVMFDHANAGGFRGTFTDAANLILLRKALLEMAKTTLGDVVTDVLIVDIVRQDA